MHEQQTGFDVVLVPDAVDGDAHAGQGSLLYTAVGAANARSRDGVAA